MNPNNDPANIWRRVIVCWITFIPATMCGQFDHYYCIIIAIIL